MGGGAPADGTLLFPEQAVVRPSLALTEARRVWGTELPSRYHLVQEKEQQRLGVSSPYPGWGWLPALCTETATLQEACDHITTGNELRPGV